MSVLAMLVVFGSVGAIAWAILSSHAHIEFPNPEQKNNVALSGLAANLPEVQSGRQTTQLFSVEPQFSLFPEIKGVSGSIISHVS